MINSLRFSHIYDEVDVEQQEQDCQYLTDKKHKIVARAIEQGDEWMTDPETALCVFRSLDKEYYRRVLNEEVTKAFKNKFNHPNITEITTKEIHRTVTDEFDNDTVMSYPYAYLVVDIRDLNDDDMYRLSDVVQRYYDVLQDEYVLAYALDHAELDVIYEHGIATVSAFTEDKYMVSFNKDDFRGNSYDVCMKPAPLKEAFRFIKHDLLTWRY